MHELEKVGPRVADLVGFAVGATVVGLSVLEPVGEAVVGLPVLEPVGEAVVGLPVLEPVGEAVVGLPVLEPAGEARCININFVSFCCYILV
jgi:hypothetical protein